MNYKQLHELNKRKMARQINNDLNFEWEDIELFDILVGKISPLNYYNYKDKNEQKIQEDLKEVNKLIRKFNVREVGSKDFLSNLKILLDDLKLKHDQLKYMIETNFNWYEERIEKYEKCLIYGVGGIGKSHFVYHLGKQLLSEKIDHCCLYGKFINDELDLSFIDEIISKSKVAEFVFELLPVK